MIEAETCWLWGERDTTHAVDRNERRALFARTIDVDGQELAVPVQLLRRIGIVVDVD